MSLHVNRIIVTLPTLVAENARFNMVVRKSVATSSHLAITITTLVVADTTLLIVLIPAPLSSLRRARCARLSQTGSNRWGGIEMAKAVRATPASQN